MYFRVLIALAAVAIIIILLRWFARAPTSNVTRFLKRLIIGGGIVLLIFLTATGRLHWLFALFGTLFAFLPRLLPLLRYVPLINNLYKRHKAAQSTANPKQGQHSTIRTRFISMTLDHDTGAMTGEVLEGQFSGKQLGELSLNELRVLYQECNKHDQQSATLLQAYLERTHGDEWHQHAESSTGAGTSGGKMSRDEAYEILGLAADAGDQEIIDAHRRLMQKLHPDRGGSTYLAAKINQAKDLLLG